MPPLEYVGPIDSLESAHKDVTIRKIEFVKDIDDKQYGNPIATAEVVVRSASEEAEVAGEEREDSDVEGYSSSEEGYYAAIVKEDEITKRRSFVYPWEGYATGPGMRFKGRHSEVPVLPVWQVPKWKDRKTGIKPV